MRASGGVWETGLSPGAGFEQPFEMLRACHERVHRMLRLLSRLREHLPSHGADDQARQAARDVMRYFDQAAPEHHRDEELHVFPPLLAQGDNATVALVQRLQQDHLQMETRWAAARKVLTDIAEGTLHALGAEEEIAYPGAAALLKGPPLEAMSRDMMARRGLR